ncbi:FAD-binding oxidoreductase [Parvularcula sp. ZS-1/3]|uniref:FAD-binding oxidoreductase n=1 Tax=Parvularcula mediterranea TaxID=2732508 RepID=A0A7Y3RJS2_9PROT|nr:FAD-binding oxidoreductase [Parvularcula mediterranea]NNU15280.1 FAD-binding oxidoreductase [Parvularcula mediterranea]
MTIPAEHIEALRALADPKSIVPEDAAGTHLEEWRGRWPGESPLILAPSATEELSRLMAEAYRRGVPMVPQGGHTGLVGGGSAKGEVIISTKRMRQVRDVSAEGFTMTLEAGITLQEAQELARKDDRLFPLSIGAEGTANIGGVLSTNAGGVHVLRYGNARDLVLGIEAVLPDGRIWKGLNQLRKNNTGYDLKHLFIGGEGTIGIITAAVLKTYPRPKEHVTAMLALPSPEHAVKLLSLAQARSGGQLGSFEVMNDGMLELVLHQFPDLPRPLETKSGTYVLMEFSSGQEGTLRETAEGILETAFEEELVIDGTVASSEAQAEALWTIRHNASEAMKKDPSPCVKADVSVPIAAIPEFLAKADAKVLEMEPGARIISFGHMGDGNIHYDILGPAEGPHDKWKARMAEFEHKVHDIVVELGGSISAEHGIGQLKRDELVTRKDPVEMDLMRTIKRSLDPKGLMNPGKLLNP